MTKEKLDEFNKEMNSLLRKYGVTLVATLQVQDLPIVEVEEAKVKEIKTEK